MSDTETVRYELTNPMIITSRLMPGVKINDGTIHIEAANIQGSRVEWHYVIDAPQGTYEATDMTTVAAGPWREEVRHALGELCGFLSFYADPDECENHDERMAEFGDVSAWLMANRDEISCMEDDLRES